MTKPAVQRPAQREPLGWAAVGALAALAFVVLIGGTSVGELEPVPRLINALIAMALLLRYVRGMPARGDRLDLAVLAGVVLFAFTGALSSAPRQSFDAVLQAATYAAALFTARDLLARPATRNAFLTMMMGLSGFLTFITAARWFPVVVGWWSAVGGSVAPPLNLELLSGPWGHRYDLALLLAVLYPAWWIGATTPLRRWVAVAIGLVIALVVLVVGSRTLWAALGGAGLLMAWPWIRAQWKASARVRLFAIAVVLLALAVFIAGGLAAALAGRATNLASLGWRTVMWGSLFEVWLKHPLAGYGPGSFPWILQTTTYFDTNSWAPRHPDSAPIELLAEGGILGLAALVVVIVSVARALRKSRSIAAVWVLLSVALVSIGANPTEFMFLMAPSVAWLAFAVPRPHEARVATAAGFAAPRLARYAVFAVIAAAFAATAVAGFAYDQAREAVEAGDLRDARPQLDLAVALDPGMALYWRQRGELAYLQGRSRDAASDLQQATQLNPSDDLAWRSLGLAAAVGGDEAGASRALMRALATQRSDVTNLLLVARWFDQHDQPSEAVATLAEVVQSWPSIVGAPGWSGVLPHSVSTIDVVDAAARRWQDGGSTPELPLDQGIWLAVLANRPDLDRLAIDRAALGPNLAQAKLAVLRCGHTLDYLNAATADEKRSFYYWKLRMQTASVAGHPDSTAVDVIRIMTSDPRFPDLPLNTLNPLDENGLPSGDIWGYRRLPISWPDSGIRLPSPDVGVFIWLVNPAHAVESAGLARQLPTCR